MSMRHVATSDRNFYDRCYFNAHDRTGEVFFVTGLGVYPNLGVTDAFATVKVGNRQCTLRLSDALGDDRTSQRVGPYSIDVLTPLESIRVACGDNDHGISFDLTWRGSFPPVSEPVHLMRQEQRVILDASRFAQVGTWAGSIVVDGERMDVRPEEWLGTRDRSWGIRPVGEAEPPGRPSAEPAEGFGFWWTYVPLLFDEFAILVIAQEDGDGTRTMSDALRVWPASAHRPVEQLGWPEFEVSYLPGTRIPRAASIGLRASRESISLEVEALGAVALNCGPGYGGDQSWTHGSWRGRGFAERTDADLTDPSVTSYMQFGVVDHVARAVIEGAEGWGMFEHGTFGRHAPSGFEDWGSVAP